MAKNVKITAFDYYRRTDRSRYQQITEATHAQGGDIIELEDVSIMYPNFAGDPDRFNPMGGKRYFTVRIDDPEMAGQLSDLGYYVVPQYEDREDPTSDIRFWKMKVKVAFNPGSRRNPELFMATEGHEFSESPLPEDLVGELDRVDILYADLKLSAFDYRDRPGASGGTGIALYLREGWFTIQESRFARKHQRRAQSNSDGYEHDEVPF